MSNEKGIGRRVAKTAGLRITIALFLGNLALSLLRSSSPAMLDDNVAQLHVFDQVSGKSGDDRRNTRSGIRTNDVADDDPPQRSDRNAFGAAHAIAETQKNRAIIDVAHADVVDSHVFEQRAVYSFQS